MRFGGGGGYRVALRARRYRAFVVVFALLLSGVGVLYVGRHADRLPAVVRAVANLEHLPVPSAAATATATATPAPTTPPVIPTRVPAVPTPTPCAGPALTAQSQVRPDTTYCGGAVSAQIQLASGDRWFGGEVAHVTTGRQQGAVSCASNCSLINMNVHDNPGAFAGIEVQSGGQTAILISGGRVTGSGSLGIGGGDVDGLTVQGVEIDHNGGSAKCGFEGGGFKGGSTHHLHFTRNYVHDNNCPGVWLDINSANNEIDHNRVIGNSHEGIFYEISQDALIHDNDVEGNGWHTDGSGCGWLWGGGIVVASSFNIQIYGNTVNGNCNGITGTQQNRPDSTPPQHLLANIVISRNAIGGAGETGVAQDNGADLTTRHISFSNNRYSRNAVLCGFAC